MTTSTMVRRVLRAGHLVSTWSVVRAPLFGETSIVKTGMLRKEARDYVNATQAAAGGQALYMYLEDANADLEVSWVALCIKNGAWDEIFLRAFDDRYIDQHVRRVAAIASADPRTTDGQRSVYGEWTRLGAAAYVRAWQDHTVGCSAMLAGTPPHPAWREHVEAITANYLAATARGDADANGDAPIIEFS